MHKLNILGLPLLTAALAAFAAASLPAQTAAVKSSSSLNVGQVNVDFGKSALTRGLWHFSAGVKMTSEQYDLTAQEVVAAFAPGPGGKAALQKATAEGSPGKNVQVDAHIRQPLEGRAFEVLADHAVYVPDKSRPNGGRMDFTGHVKVISNSGFLAEPSVSTFENGPVIVLMGQGDDYPQLQTGPGHIVITPAQ